MLVPAILYKEEIEKKIAEYIYSDDMLYYTGFLGHNTEIIKTGTDEGNCYQYAIIDEDKLIGYFTYYIDWHTSCVSSFGLFSFDRGNLTIGFDINRELKKIINTYKIHRMEWRMIGGNPVEKHYDKFCEKYGGKKIILTDAVKDRQGNYRNNVIYEIIFNR